MDAEDLRTLLLSQAHSTEETPFGPEHLVYKIGGHKMFALFSPEEVPLRVNLKCDPDRALDLRDQHEAIIPGYHMDKRHWNTVLVDGTLPTSLITELVEHSFALVYAGLTRKLQAEFPL